VQRREVKKIAKSRPAEHGLPFSTWSLPKLAEFLVAEGVVDDISHEGLRMLFREEGVTFQRLKTWKASKDPEHAVKKARVEHLYAIADREVVPEPGEPEVMFCVDEFGPLNLQIARHVVRLAKILGASYIFQIHDCGLGREGHDCKFPSTCHCRALTFRYYLNNDIRPLAHLDKVLTLCGHYFGASVDAAQRRLFDNCPEPRWLVTL